jgi:NitT/TauT family transport system substrate-binding protein
LRYWLKTQGLASNVEGGGDVSILPQANAQTLETFRAKNIHGAWVPEPWATRLVLEGGGSVLVDERSLWPGGKFVTTHVIVRTAFLKEHPDVVSRFLRAHVQAIDFLSAEPVKGREIVNKGIERLTGKALPPAIIERAWTSLTFTVDPLAATLRKSAQDATDVGLLEKVDLAGIYDLAPLNAVLAASGKPPVSS